MTVRTFVDTNVWVYAQDSRDSAKRARAREVLRADPAGLWTSPQVMGELYVTLTRRMQPPMDASAARSIVGNLAGLNVVPLEAAHVLEAMETAGGGQVAYWDALIVAAARSAGCERILTEDLAAGTQVAGVRIENPFASVQNRLAETERPYEATRAEWDDCALREELARYEAACRAAGMQPNAVHSYWDYARRFLDWREGAYPRRAAVRPVPARPVGTPDLRNDAAAYRQALAVAGLSAAAIETYVRHALFLVRWLAGEFRPGARLGPRAG
jgi:predicted nucleic acid-binding protein